MMTWLDRLCRSESLNTEDNRGDPRRAMAAFVGSLVQMQFSFDNMLDEIFYVTLMPILAPYLPEGASMSIGDDGLLPDRPLGIILTRETANFLSEAAPIGIPDSLWRERLGPRQVVYIDIPHGALTFNRNGHNSEVVQLRSILAAPFLPPSMPGHTQFVVQLTERGTERGRGRVAGMLCPNGKISLVAGDKSGLAVDTTMQAPFAHPLLHKAVLGLAGNFLRLVIAYYFFAPPEAKDVIRATSTERLRNGKPRNGESLFAMTRLHPSKGVGRPSSSIRPSWNLSEKQEVSGHFKLQAYGPKWTDRRLIWVDDYGRGPENGPVRPKGVQI